MHPQGIVGYTYHGDTSASSKERNLRALAVFAWVAVTLISCFLTVRDDEHNLFCNHDLLPPLYTVYACIFFFFKTRLPYNSVHLYTSLATRLQLALSTA